MPRSDQFTVILDHEIANLTALVCREVRRPSERHGFEPEVGERPVALDVNVSAFAVFITEVEEPVRAYAKDGGTAT
jgi:hypothetical protein